MDSSADKLARKIVILLKGADYQESVKALQIAKILLPTPAQRRAQQKKREAAEEIVSNEGDLTPADEDLMKFSKAMQGSEPAAVQEAKEEPELE